MQAEHSKDYCTALSLCKNLRKTIDVINYKERYSGTKKAILMAVTDSNTNVLAAAKLLHVSCNAKINK